MEIKFIIIQMPDLFLLHCLFQKFPMIILQQRISIMVFSHFKFYHFVDSLLFDFVLTTVFFNIHM